MQFRRGLCFQCEGHIQGGWIWRQEGQLGGYHRLCSLSASFSKERTLLWTECLCSPPPDSYVKTESPIDVLEARPLEVD